MNTWYRWVNILSLDVAAGAVVCALFFVRITNAEVYPVSLLVLGLSVWIIYTSDHLKDAYNLNQVASTHRHRFHQKNFKPLLIFLSLALMITIGLIFYLRTGILSWGFGLALFVSIYLIFNQYLLFIKEIAATILYCSGVLLPALSQSPSIRSLLLRWETIVFALLVMINLLLFSVYEMEYDSQSHHRSFALYFGKHATMKIIHALLIIAGGIVVYQIPSAPISILLIFGFMTLTLALIAVFPSQFSTHDRYRHLGDLIFLFPALVLFS